MVGPWQVPVADCAVTLADFEGFAGRSHVHGRAHAAGRAGRARLRPHGGGRSHYQLAGCTDSTCRASKLSANWMAACGEPGEDAALYATVKAVGMELCPALGISIPVGKDSLSMRTQWKDDGDDKKVTSPVSLIVSGFATLQDVRGTLTPQLNATEDTTLVLVDLGRGRAPHGRQHPGADRWTRWATRCLIWTTRKTW